ncbi:polysaccharide deacetylase family protein [Clostridium paridis]|uniref:Polysaccharide deacetylase family protein n=1 Tax=Clostridium paridis TaxID=2803863 RepID=A0A937FKE2_9CLOT|nr:polysaccharide deacetylase family protein [Clostridium paridis]MBL4933411.1 polysaccharide deacetylase family protein [Clostridium paridis]
MKNKRNILKVIIVLLIIDVALCVYGFVNSNNSKKSSTATLSDNVNTTAKTTIDTTTTSPAKEEPTKEEPVKKDRFEGKKLVIPKDIPVLCYHAFGDDKSDLFVTAAKFKEQLEYLKNNGYFTLTIDEFSDYILNKKPVPEKSVLITIDDGYLNNYQIAYPILKELGMNATIFIITSGVGDNGYYMTSAQLVEMSQNGIDIGSHTTNHQELDKLSYAEQLKIAKDSKADLEKIIGKPINTFCYPFGKYNQDTKKAAKDAGYSLSFNLGGGTADLNDNPENIDRVAVLGKYDMNKFVSLLK